MKPPHGCSGNYNATMRYEPPTPDPTPEEIAEMCAEIQENWTETDRYIRSVSTSATVKNAISGRRMRQRYSVPMIRVADLGIARGRVRSTT